jgi:hypothetical protein
MKKKKIYLQSIVVAICCSLFAITSCEDMLTVDSGRYVTVDKNGLASANDSVTSILGLLRGMQKVGERYILLGEMRADLMDVTNYTPTDIRQLSDFNVDSTNTYANPRDFYAIINNCNYFISRTAASGSPLKTENAVAHAIRTWTYMQIATNWGKAYYFTKPLLTVNDTKENYPILRINQLTDSLIADLEPFADAIYPNYGVINSFNSSDLLLPIKVLLGDLYLWRGRSTSDYETAATYYSQFIDKKMPPADPVNPLSNLTSSPSIEWTFSNYNLTTHVFDKYLPNDNWSSYTGTFSSSSIIEFVSAIQMATSFSDGIVCQIPSNIDYFAASSGVKDLWSKQIYTLHYRPVLTKPDFTNYTDFGDLREKANLFTYSLTTSTGSTNSSQVTNYTGLTKLLNSRHILLYRMGLIYLRYAEAVNRAGHPQTAFAVLKYGLNPVSFADSTIIPIADRNIPYIGIFNNDKYTNIIGIHARGCGDAAYDATYKIPDSATDSISRLNWVEDAICDELALETSFEGNRFGDLVRMAMRRNNDFLAKRIASKHEGSEYGRIYGILSDQKNWFLTEPK